MKLKNKKTGEIIETVIVDHGAEWEIRNMYTDEGTQTYDSLAELNEEWEDYEEPKEFWFVDSGGEVEEATYLTDNDKSSLRSFGNYFETREEAELAVCKLEAWKRLEDKGFRPKMWEWEYIYDDNISGELIIKAHIDDATDSDGKYTKDLDLLFGGEE